MAAVTPGFHNEKEQDYKCGEFRRQAHSLYGASRIKDSLAVHDGKGERAEDVQPGKRSLIRPPTNR